MSPAWQRFRVWVDGLRKSPLERWQEGLAAELANDHCDSEMFRGLWNMQRERALAVIQKYMDEYEEFTRSAR